MIAWGSILISSLILIKVGGSPHLHVQNAYFATAQKLLFARNGDIFPVSIVFFLNGANHSDAVPTKTMAFCIYAEE